MSEAADRVTDYALAELGWPHLWLCNAEINVASHRVKQKQGAVIIDRTPRSYVYGEGVRVTWLLTREAWLARRVGLSEAILPGPHCGSEGRQNPSGTGGGGRRR